jgi:feruloyl esterase
MYHGLADPLVLPDNSISYYESVAIEMGGRAKIDDFFRLFTVPGMGHCWELPADTADQFNPLLVLENWVERGEAPEQIYARARHPGSAVSSAAAICPYPAEAVTHLDPLADNKAACMASEPQQPTSIDHR